MRIASVASGAKLLTLVNSSFALNVTAKKINENTNGSKNNNNSANGNNVIDKSQNSFNNNTSVIHGKLAGSSIPVANPHGISSTIAVS